LLLFIIGLLFTGLGIFTIYRATHVGVHCISGPVAILALGVFTMLAALAPLLLFSLIICTDASIRNRSLWIGLLSVPASFIQLTGYGTGFLRAWWKRCLLGKDEFAAFEKNFYK